MSKIKSQRSRFQINRRRKLARRQAIRALRTALAAKK